MLCTGHMKLNFGKQVDMENQVRVERNMIFDVGNCESKGSRSFPSERKSAKEIQVYGHFLEMQMS